MNIWLLKNRCFWSKRCFGHGGGGRDDEKDKKRQNRMKLLERSILLTVSWPSYLYILEDKPENI